MTAPNLDERGTPLADEDIARVKSRGTRWLEAYYYVFDPTGCEPVDVMLATIALAGKLFHSTSEWNDRPSYAEDEPSPVELIQRAANSLAALLTDGSERAS